MRNLRHIQLMTFTFIYKSSHLKLPLAVFLIFKMKHPGNVNIFRKLNVLLQLHKMILILQTFALIVLFLRVFFLSFTFLKANSDIQ